MKKCRAELFADYLRAYRNLHWGSVDFISVVRTLLGEPDIRVRSDDSNPDLLYGGDKVICIYQHDDGSRLRVQLSIEVIKPNDVDVTSDTENADDDAHNR